MRPLDEIRADLTLDREVAKEATPGPWHTGSRPGRFAALDSDRVASAEATNRCGAELLAILEGGE